MHRIEQTQEQFSAQGESGDEPIRAGGRAGDRVRAARATALPVPLEVEPTVKQEE